jgi:Fe-S-cluster-containing dehydrogenase component/DMSO reductase anchor subunit
LIDAYLAEQRQLTAALQFSEWHERRAAHEPEARYRDLIPLHAPRPGEQYAFEVDLDRCSGCKGCVTACHALNGLDDDESWRTTGQLVGELQLPYTRADGTLEPVGRSVIPLQQTVTTACHHCLEPACLSGCPVLAYDKDPATGIVRHLDDQCIGCSYCLMMCPYEVPKYSASRGIVRKCDLCHGRLAANEAPACVQACPNEAIRIALVDTASWRATLTAQDATRTQPETETVNPPVSPGLSGRGKASAREISESGDEWLPDSPAPSITWPTTRYVSRNTNAVLLAADHGQPRVAPAHWPLVLMLVLTQAGAGAFVVALHALALPLAVLALSLFCGGLAASVLHLGRPAKAWRVWLGWRTSWLSREAIAVNVFAAFALALLISLWFRRTGTSPDGNIAAGAWWFGQAWLPWLAAGLALLTTSTQAMVYVDTRRPYWNASRTLPRFLGTTLLGGLAAAFATRPGPVTAAALGAAALVKLGVEFSVLKYADTDATRWTCLRRSASLLRSPLRGWLALRTLLLLAGGLFLPFALLTNVVPPSWAGAAFCLCLLGEIGERMLYFKSVAPDRMPGMP